MYITRFDNLLWTVKFDGDLMMLSVFSAQMALDPTWIKNYQYNYRKLVKVVMIFEPMRIRHVMKFTQAHQPVAESQCFFSGLTKFVWHEPLHCLGANKTILVHCQHESSIFYADAFLWIFHSCNHLQVLATILLYLLSLLRVKMKGVSCRLVCCSWFTRWFSLRTFLRFSSPKW